MPFCPYDTSTIFSAVGERLAAPDVAMPFIPHIASIISSTVGRWLVCRRSCNAFFAAQCGYNSIITSDDRWSPLQPNIDCSRKSHQISLHIMGQSEPPHNAAFNPDFIANSAFSLYFFVKVCYNNRRNNPIKFDKIQLNSIKFNKTEMLLWNPTSISTKI